MDDHELDALREQGETINREAFPDEVEVAYHALAMALHAAQSLGDAKAVLGIASRAEVQARLLEERAGEPAPNAYLGSAIASQARIFASLGQQAKMTAIRLSLPGQVHARDGG